jgi:hypothetical protein
MAKAIEVITHTRVGTGRTAVHTFVLKGASPTVEGGDLTVVTDCAKIHAGIFDEIINERIKAKHVDAAAIPMDKKSGLSASPITKGEKLGAVSERLQTGAEDAWNSKRAAAVEYDIGPLVCQALVALGDAIPRVKGDPVKAQALVVGWTPEQRKAVSPRADVAAEINKIRSKAAEGIDTDALLAELV